MMQRTETKQASRTKEEQREITRCGFAPLFPCYVRHAANDAFHWLAPSGTRSRQRKPEVRWLEMFRSGGVTGTEIGWNRYAWSIRGVGTDRYDGIARLAKAASDARPQAAGAEGIVLAVNALAAALGDKKAGVTEVAAATEDPPPEDVEGSPLLSWASKLLLHAWPDLPVMVLDSKAEMAVGIWTDLPPAESKQKSSKDANRYARFYGRCWSYYQETCTRPEFESELKALHADLKEESPLYREPWSGEFIARRMFDKFLSHQGVFAEWRSLQFGLPSCLKVTTSCSLV
jgi:hypothetical protein